MYDKWNSNYLLSNTRHQMSKQRLNGRTLLFKMRGKQFWETTRLLFTPRNITSQFHTTIVHVYKIKQSHCFRLIFSIGSIILIHCTNTMSCPMTVHWPHIRRPLDTLSIRYYAHWIPCPSVTTIHIPLSPVDTMCTIYVFSWCVHQTTVGII